MSGPKLVLLDEPSMGLAPVIVAQVFDLVRRIRSEGYTVLIVEQNVRQVLKVADRAYLLEVGRIKAARHGRRARRQRRHPQGVHGDMRHAERHPAIRPRGGERGTQGRLARRRARGSPHPSRSPQAGRDDSAGSR